MKRLRPRTIPIAGAALAALLASCSPAPRPPAADGGAPAPGPEAERETSAAWGRGQSGAAWTFRRAPAKAEPHGDMSDAAIPEGGADGAFAGAPPAEDDASARRGRHIYMTFCASCHGEGGSGDGALAPREGRRPADLRGVTRRHHREALMLRVHFGLEAMPAWRDTLSRDDLWDLTHYLRTL